jgi:hypothetical protein
MASLLIRRRRPIDEPAGSASTLDGTKGAGRIVLALAELGVEIATGHGAVRQLVVDPDTPIADLGRLDVGGRFERLLLGSHLVNRPEEDVRAALLGLALRHLAPGGRVLVEHHPIDWASTAADVQPTPGGGGLGMVDVRRDPPFVSAVSVYDVGGRVVRQPFRARVLSEAELDAALAVSGLRRTRRLGPTWLEAEPA